MLFIYLISWMSICYFFIPKINSSPSQLLNCPLLTEQKKNLPEYSLDLSPHVQIINTSKPIDASFRCIKAKKLLRFVSTTICLHETVNDMYISAAFEGEDSIWEEGGVSLTLILLMYHPHLDFIDIGANIGTYTMYAAALGRFVLAVECFGPNVDRLHRAIQLRNVANRVVLVQNAIYSHSGELLRLSNDPTNIGGQEIKISTNQTSLLNDSYTVKTIQFDDLYPIFVSRGIRGAIMKIDIEGSESFVMQSGSRIFDSFDIPFIQMEWMKVRAYPDRVKLIMDFFTSRNYDPMTFACQLLNSTQYPAWPGDICWIKRNVSNFC
jgi:FkbM family methyltransferase